MTTDKMIAHCKDYAQRLHDAAMDFDYTPVATLAEELTQCLEDGRQVFICGNGGSGANAVHIANDFLYPITKEYGKGINIQALTANSAVVTCLANDEGYDEIFAYQLGVQANDGDVLIVLSGSGNSPNIVRALEAAKDKNMKTCGILGFSGGKVKDMVDTPIHFAIDDMQISEDLQMMVANMIMQWMHTHYKKA